MLTITHTHADGTTLDGSCKHDGVLEIVRRHRFDWHRGPGIHIPNSRDKDARRADITAAADALRAAGHEVTVEIDDTPRATAEREADRAERADARAERYAERASKAARVEQAHRAAERAIGDHMPLGEPIKIGHHSERKHRRAFEKMDAHMGKAIDAADRARELTHRAEAVGHNLAHRADPRVTMRRIERLRVDARHWARVLADTTPGSEYRERAEREAARLAEEIAHWEAELATLRAAEVFVPWGPEHFRKGDRVNVHGRWYPVVRVNRKSVSVPPLIGMGSTESPAGVAWSWTDTAPWDKIGGRRRDGMQLDKPNGEAWPVELARKVARWADLLRSVGRGGYDDDARRQDRYVGWAQRIAHGLDLGASDSEVEAFAPHADDTDTRRALAAAYVEVFDRLTAGEREPDIRASLPAMPEVEPEWTMPEGEPQRLPVRDVQPGDIIAGMWERGFAGSGERLLRGFAGPVAEVIPHDGPDHSGERFIGWWVVTLTTGDSRQFKPWQPLAVHPAEPVADVEPVSAAEPEPTPPGELADLVVYGANGAEPGVLVDSTAADDENGAVRVRLAGARPRGFAPGVVVSFAAAADAWHVVNAAGVVVAGGPGISRSRAEEIAAGDSPTVRAWAARLDGVPVGDVRLSAVRGVPGVTYDAAGCPLPPAPVAEPVTVHAARGVCPQCGTGTEAPAGLASVTCAADGCGASVPMGDVETFNPARPYPFPPVTITATEPAAPVNPWDDLLAAHLHTTQAA